MAFTAYTPHYAEPQLHQRNYALVSLALFLESALWVLVLVFFSGAIVGLTFPTAEALEAGDSPVARLLWYPIYGIVALMVLKSFPKVLQLVSRNPLIIVCVLWLGLTFFWSIDPGLTMRRSISLVMTTLAGLAFAARYDWDEMVQRIAVAILIVCLITLALILVNPTRGIMQEIYPGAWRGPWAEKNYLGGIMAKGFAITLCAYAFRPSRLWLWGPTALLCIFIMLMSGSKTALLALMGCFGIFVIIRIYRRFPVLRTLVIWSIIAGIAGMSLLMTVGAEWALGLIGKDPTLTGRTDIWILLWMAITENFWLGYGYGTFWMDPLGPSYQVRAVLEWSVPTAHNGWFDSWLSGGVVIIALFGSLVVTTLVKSIRRVKYGGTESYWLILSLFFFLLFSISESAILQQNDISWLLFVATTAKLWANDPPWRHERPQPPAYAYPAYMTR